MKAKVLDKEGKAIKEIVLPSCFCSKIREDICQKYFQAIRKMQPYAPNIFAGKLYSASGKIRHGRRLWKTSYGRGISRVPRKIFWRRGTQFYWSGSTISGTRGGRRAHPPKIEHFLKEKKINKKEKLLAIRSAISSTCLLEYLRKRYLSLSDLKEKEISLPLIVSSDLLKLKTKEFLESLKKILGGAFLIALKKKRKRAGKGKSRGRKYKKSAGLLLVIGKDENKKISGIDVKKVNELGISDFYPLGRLCIYTEKAISDLEKLWQKEKEKK